MAKFYLLSLLIRNVRRRPYASPGGVAIIITGVRLLALKRFGETEDTDQWRNLEGVAGWAFVPPSFTAGRCLADCRSKPGISRLILLNYI